MSVSLLLLSLVLLSEFVHMGKDVDNVHGASYTIIKSG